MKTGSLERLGCLMNENQSLLGKIGVSSEELENLVRMASEAGALGAKLSGAGKGGIMIALVTPNVELPVENKLRAGGAKFVMKASIPVSAG